MHRIQKEGSDRWGLISMVTLSCLDFVMMELLLVYVKGNYSCYFVIFLNSNFETHFLFGFLENPFFLMGRSSQTMGRWGSYIFLGCILLNNNLTFEPSPNVRMDGQVHIVITWSPHVI
ncbi:unnamed protein product, partial [Vitis vinifera]